MTVTTVDAVRPVTGGIDTHPDLNVAPCLVTGGVGDGRNAELMWAPDVPRRQGPGGGEPLDPPMTSTPPQRRRLGTCWRPERSGCDEDTEAGRCMTLSATSSTGMRRIRRILLARARQASGTTSGWK